MPCAEQFEGGGVSPQGLTAHGGNRHRKGQRVPERVHSHSAQARRRRDRAAGRRDSAGLLLCRLHGRGRQRNCAHWQTASVVTKERSTVYI